MAWVSSLVGCLYKASHLSHNVSHYHLALSSPSHLFDTSHLQQLESVFEILSGGVQFLYQETQAKIPNMTAIKNVAVAGVSIFLLQ